MLSLRNTNLPSLFEEFSRVNEQMNHFFGMDVHPGRQSASYPPVNVYNEDDRYVVTAELPGVNQEDLDIQVEKNTLTIKGERKSHENRDNHRYQRREVRFGSFTRSIKLSTPVESESVTATYQNGVLEISLPKTKESQPTKIKIEN